MSDDDSDWGETPVKKRSKMKKEKNKKEKDKEDMDKSIIEDEIVQMLDDDHEEQVRLRMLRLAVTATKF